ncbi:MAG: CBS domain-containing protein [Arenicella sp.]|jgi:CBS domain-containing protein
MLKSVDMQDYMLSNPVKIKADTDIFEAIHQILIYKVSGLCVVDDNNILIGVLSEMDCLRAILGAVYNDSPAVGVASEFMTEDVISVALHDNIVDVANDMLKHKHRRRPVIDQRGRLVGQVTCRQLLRGVKDFVSPKDPSEH